MSELATLYVVIPCYNEEKVLPVTAPMFLEKIKSLRGGKRISERSRILFVDDGSRDRTWDIIKNLAESDEHYLGIRQSRNRGHQNAVLAGLMEAEDVCDITISIDCDGQDDINAMDEMIDLYYQGNEIVYGVRNNRDTDSVFKRVTAQGFYKFMRLMGVETVYNHADYRLLSARVIHELSNFKEVNLFLRGMIPLVGFQSTSVYYKREERIAGESHYPLRAMMKLALNGVTSLSVKPIRMITVLGFLVSILSFVGIIWSVIRFFTGQTITGWASMICIVCFFGGVQLLALGIIGEYIGKIYLETKARPRYIISERTQDLEK